MPKLLNIKRDGWPSDAVNIMRPGPYGNQFVMGRDGTREQCVRRHAEAARQNPLLVQAARRELRGRDLLCCCAPLPCHGIVLMEIANS